MNKSRVRWSWNRTSCVIPIVCITIYSLRQTSAVSEVRRLGAKMRTAAGPGIRFVQDHSFMERQFLLPAHSAQPLDPRSAWFWLPRTQAVSTITVFSLRTGGVGQGALVEKSVRGGGVPGSVPHLFSPFLFHYCGKNED